MSDPRDPSGYRVKPRLRYGTVAGVNGPLVILDNVGPPPPRHPADQTALI